MTLAYSNRLFAKSAFVFALLLALPGAASADMER